MKTQRALAGGARTDDDELEIARMQAEGPVPEPMDDNAIDDRPIQIDCTEEGTRL